MIEAYTSEVFADNTLQDMGEPGILERLRGISTSDIAAGDRTALDEVFLALFLKDFPRAHLALARLPKDWWPRLRSIVNKQFLCNFELEWTSHGINRTFRYWSIEEKQRYLRFAGWVLEALNESFEATLGYGSVLSIVRDGDLIPHDDDLDILVLMKASEDTTYREALEKVTAHLHSYGFKTSGDHRSHRHVTNERFWVDIFVGLEEEGFVSWHPGPRRQIPKATVFPAAETTLLGSRCSIPADPEGYLEQVYGKDWRTPQPGWSHSFDPKDFADWFWPGAGPGILATSATKEFQQTGEDSWRFQKNGESLATGTIPCWFALFQEKETKDKYYVGFLKIESDQDVMIKAHLCSHTVAYEGSNKTYLIKAHEPLDIYLLNLFKENTQGVKIQLDVIEAPDLPVNLKIKNTVIAEYF